ncbi:MAG: helix-turn-helix domain-containing protein [Bacteroidota bacterium]|nr:helix-turn-helix domain-containing protein [Bacteroidota bacterium]
MKQVAILALHDAVSASVADPSILFNGVNDFLHTAGKPSAFNVQLVGLTKAVKLHKGVFTVHTDVLLRDLKKADIVIIPALGGEMVTALKKNKAFIPWILKQYKKGADVASLCVGAFLLAATGLLNGKECSTHWIMADRFREMFPEVTLVDGRVVTEQNGLYSSGGATSYWNLLLHIVEKYAGREMAIMASKIYALEIDRKSQSPFIMFNGQKGHVDEPIREAQNYIESKVSERISVGELAARFAIGRRHFERRFKKATNNTPVEYIQRVKIEAAKKHFETSRKNVNEVMYDVGYSDTKAFRTMFKKITGLSPLDYKNRYNIQAN